MSTPTVAARRTCPGSPARTARAARRRSFRSLIAVPAALLAASVIAVPSALAHDASEPISFAATQQALAKAEQAAAPTVQHEEEHEAIYALERKIAKMSPAAKAAMRRRALGVTSTSSKARRLADQVVGPPSVYGAWTTPPFKAPTYAIHAVLLPTGRVLVMSMGSGHGAGRTGSNVGSDVNNDGQAAIWDPTRGTGPDSFKQIDPPPTTLDDPARRKGYNKLRPAPVYCTGHVQMADGRVLIAGGNLEAGNGGYGLKLLFVFDPFTETWVRQKDMGVARWYPTLTRLPSGQVVVLAGRDEKGVNRPEVELYPAPGQPIPGIDTSAQEQNTNTATVSTRKLPSFYPHAYVMKSGKLAVVGPTMTDQGILDPSTFTWTNSLGYRQGASGFGSSFLEPSTIDGPDRVFYFGGLSTRGALQPLVSSTRPGIDARWLDQPGLKLSRRNSPAVILADGTVMAIGGGTQSARGVDPTAQWPSRRQPEIWDPATRTWKRGPAQQRPRGYHSTAMLLPDGRVLSAGDDLQSYLFDDNLSDKYDTTFELYSPAYLFKGPRPVITSSPARANYGTPFTFTVEGDASAITRVTAVSPGSNTHAFDMNQRHLDLQIVNTEGNSVTVLAPPTAAAAPPGDYMVFALTAEGVPSVAKFIQVLPFGAPGHPADDSAPNWGGPTPTPTPTPVPTPTPTDGATPVSTPVPTATPQVPTPTAEPTPIPATPAPTPTPAPTKAPRPWWWPFFLPWNG